MPCGGRLDLLGSVVDTLEGARKQDRVVVSNPNDQIQCLECKRALSEHFTWCPWCGARLFPYQCEYCGITAPRNAQNCPGCGAPVG